MFPLMAPKALSLHLSLPRPPHELQAVSPYPSKAAAGPGSISPQTCPAWPWLLASLSLSPEMCQVPRAGAAPVPHCHAPTGMLDGPCPAHLVNHQPSWSPDRLPHYLVTPCEDFLSESSVYSSLLSHLLMHSLCINFVIVFDLPSDCTGAHLSPKGENTF